MHHYARIHTIRKKNALLVKLIYYEITQRSCTSDSNSILKRKASTLIVRIEWFISLLNLDSAINLSLKKMIRLNKMPHRRKPHYKVDLRNRSNIRNISLSFDLQTSTVFLRNRHYGDFLFAHICTYLCVCSFGNLKSAAIEARVVRFARCNIYHRKASHNKSCLIHRLSH